MRFIHGHHMRVTSYKHKPRSTIEDRFWSKVRKLGEELCWLWEGTIASGTGYGYFFTTRHDTAKRAHRFSWELLCGPIPEGLHILHRCPGGANRRCVNPAHLYPGTDYENMHDAIREGTHIAIKNPEHMQQMRAARQRIPHGEDLSFSKLTEAAIRDIRASFPQIPGKALAVKYGVSGSTISQIVHRTRWKHVE